MIMSSYKLKDYAEKVAKIKNRLKKYNQERRELLASDIYAPDYKDEMVAKLTVQAREDILNALDGMKEQAKKDLAAAYKTQAPANPEEAQYWATVIFQDLSLLPPRDIINAYKQIIKEANPIKKAEFERVAKRILQADDSLHAQLNEFYFIQHESMTPSEQDKARCLYIAEALEDTLFRVQDYAVHNVKLIEDGIDPGKTGQINYIDVPFQELGEKLKDRFENRPSKLHGDHFSKFK